MADWGAIARGAIKSVGYSNPLTSGLTRYVDNNGLVTKALDPNYDLVKGVSVTNRPGDVDINPFNGPAVKGAETTRDSGGGGSNGGGGGGGNTVQYAAADPVPQTYTDSMGRTWNSYGEFQRNQDNVRRNVNVKEKGYISGAKSDVRGARSTYSNNAQDFVTGLRKGQNTINSGRANNALNLRRSMAGIASGIRQGIRSGAVNLANMNAMDSGASIAMARAFARQGNSQAAAVNNEAQLAENQFATEQQNLRLDRQQGLGRLKTWRDDKVKDISSKLWQNLSEIDAAAQAEGLNGIVDMAARDRVVAQANAELNEVDSITQRELAKIQALDMGEVNQRAAEMDAAGALVENPFAYESGTVQWGQNPDTPDGAPIGPIGTAPRYRDEEVNPLALARPVEEEEAVV